MSNSDSREIKYIYQLPFSEHKELCRLLDDTDRWEDLAGLHMNFDVMTIHELRRNFQRGYPGFSPTEELLNRWGQQNHTILELFALLSKMQHYRAMTILKPFVDQKYHRFIYEGSNFLALPLQSKPLGGSKENVSDGVGVTSFSVPHGTRLARGDVPNITDKDLHLGSHNLNVASDQRRAVHTKVLFPPNTSGVGCSEQKVINIEQPEQGTPTSNEQNDAVLLDRSNMTTQTPVASYISTAAPVSPNAAAIRSPAGTGGHDQYQTDNKENSIPAPPSQRKMSNASEASSIAESCGSIPDIPYKELLVATNNWDKHTILGKGGFGTVFKGLWKNTEVAIKRIEQRAESDESYQAQIEQSLRELKVLNSCRHDNILPIYGFCMGGDEPCLVYQYMPNGSVEDRLLCRNGTTTLSWQQRHKIAEGTARGLQFLHKHTKPFIHGDIKSANILLNINFEPRIGDFGLAREGPQSHYTHMKVSRVHGTRPYLPDEFLRSKQISTKVDTYSFGIVLFELATGQRAYDDSRSKKFLKDYVETCEEEDVLSLADKKSDPCDQEIFLELLSLGKVCVQRRAKDRPEMEEVLKQLQGTSERRLIASRAHSMVRQTSITPSNPYELQLAHDKGLLAQQRHPSPTPSPIPYPVADNFCLAQGDLKLAYLSALYQHQHQQNHLVGDGLTSPVVHNNPFVSDATSSDHGQRVKMLPEEEKRLKQQIQYLLNSFKPVDPKCSSTPESVNINGGKIHITDNNQNIDPIYGKTVGNSNCENVASQQHFNPFTPNLIPNSNGAMEPVGLNAVWKAANVGFCPNVLATRTCNTSELNVNQMAGSGLGQPQQPPVIAVTPPTASFSWKIAASSASGTASDRSSPVSSKPENAAGDQEEAVISVGEASVGGLPLLSALGIKDNDDYDKTINEGNTSRSDNDVPVAVNETKLLSNKLSA